MTYCIIYAKVFDPKSLRSISKSTLQKLKKSIEKKLSTAPDIHGKPLRHSLKGFWSLRFQDYRVLYRIHKKNVVEIYAIRHRSEAYDWFLERVKKVR